MSIRYRLSLEESSQQRIHILLRLHVWCTIFCLPQSQQRSASLRTLVTGTWPVSPPMVRLSRHRPALKPISSTKWTCGELEEQGRTDSIGAHSFSGNEGTRQGAKDTPQCNRKQQASRPPPLGNELLTPPRLARLLYRAKGPLSLFRLGLLSRTLL